MIHYIKSVWSRIKPFHILFACVGIIFLVNSQYVSYPDEFVNLLGGKSILQGKIPYRDFFDHHLPFAWYLSAVIQLFSFGSFVLFRYWWALLAFCSLLMVGLWMHKRNKELFPYYVGYFFLFPFISVYYWTHLFLADSLAFLLFSILFWVLIGETYQKTPRTQTLYILLWINFCFLFSSLTFIYISGFIYLWIGMLFLKEKRARQEIMKFIFISALPYGIYALYLLLSNSWKEFYISNFVYNTKLYMHIPNYSPGRFFNPIKFAFTVIHNFYQSYIPLLVRIKEFNLYFPVDLTIALGSFLFFLVLTKEKPFIAVLFFFILSFSAPRSNLMKIGDRDYQSGLFIALGYISAFLVLWRYPFVRLSHESLDVFKKALIVLLLFFGVFASLFLIQNTYDKFFFRYSQVMPSVYDHAPTAFFIDEILEKGDYYWVGPYEPQEEFFVKKARLPGKFPTLLPQFREDEYFKTEFIKQFETNPPKLIIFKHDASIFMTPAMEFGKFFLDWMEADYISLEKVPGITVLKSPETFNLKTDIYIHRDAYEKIMSRLNQSGYIIQEKKSR